VDILRLLDGINLLPVFFPETALSCRKPYGHHLDSHMAAKAGNGRFVQVVRRKVGCIVQDIFRIAYCKNEGVFL
jgi:hypothetical protein